MDSFPDTVSRAYYQAVIRKGQEELLRATRERFTNEIDDAGQKLKKRVQLTFPEEMWDTYKIQIASELLDRFGEIMMKSQSSQFTREGLTVDKEDIPSDLSSLIIELDKNT